MRKENSSKIKLTAIVLFMAASLITFAIQKQEKQVNTTNIEDHTPEDSAYVPPVYDKMLLSRFEQLCQKLEGKDGYAFSGSVSASDGADTTQAIKETNFIMCKKGQELYYKMGDSETINASGAYVLIDHAEKKVALSNQRDIVMPLGIQGSSLSKNLASEYYNLTSKTNGNERSISIINEQHLTCKEYSITYDTLSNDIKRIYTRLSGSGDPLNRDNEQVIDIRIMNWEKPDGAKHYFKNKAVKKKGADWELTKPYLSYELIRF